MATLREEAEFQRLALAMGLINVNAVVAWADRVIDESAEPANEVIDIALAGKQRADEVMSLLERIKGSGDLTTAAHQVLGLFRRRFIADELTLETAVDMLHAYYCWANVSDTERYHADYFRDELSLFQEGYGGSREHIRQGILEFTLEYAAVCTTI